MDLLTPSIWKKLLKLEAKAIEKGKTLSRPKIMAELKISEHNARAIQYLLKFRGITSNGDLQSEAKVVNEFKSIKGKLKQSQDEVLRLSKSLDWQNRMAGVDFQPPKWLQPGASQDTAIATAILSDCHFDEVVDSCQVDGVNGYSRCVAEMRLQKFFESCVKLGRDYFSGVKVEGMVLALCGDMVSGSIHEELAETNEAPIINTCLHYSELIAAGINLLVKQYGKVFIPCVVGNHGRLTKQIRHKGRVQDNFDWLMYKLLERHFASNKKVTFYIPDSPDAHWTIYNTRYRMTHGDQFRGGNGIAGIFSPISRGDHKKRKRQTSMGASYDILIMGHFHQLLDMGSIVANGSLKGMDEYAYSGNFDFEVPRQAFWLTDPKRGKTMFAPVHVDSKDEPWKQDGKMFVDGVFNA